MSELLIFEEDQLKSIKEMLLSKDKESVKLAFGILSSFDYNNKEELDKLSDSIYEFALSEIPFIYDPNTFEPLHQNIQSRLIYIIEKLKYDSEFK